MKNRNLKGFTLIELIIVIVIVAVLTAILVPTFIHYVNESKLATANANAKQVYTIIEEYCSSCKNAGYYVNNNNVYKPAALPLEWGASDPQDYAYNGEGQQLRYAIVAQMGGQKGFTKFVVENSSAKSAVWAKGMMDNYIGEYPAEKKEKISGTFQAYNLP